MFRICRFFLFWCTSDLISVVQRRMLLVLLSCKGLRTVTDSLLCRFVCLFVCREIRKMRFGMCPGIGLLFVDGVVGDAANCFYVCMCVRLSKSA